jgi:GT2 family glycosyltransferase
MTIKNTPEIAMLMPVYNPGADLVGTLDSLRAQTIPFKLFLVDDGSKFHTDYETLTQGLDVNILRLPKNLGITGAMNAGLDEILKGPYPLVARLDAGDMSRPERLERQRDYFHTHPEISILGSAVEFRLKNAEDELTATQFIHFPENAEGCRRRLFWNVPCIHPAMMLRRDVFVKLNGYSEAYPAAEDYDLMWRADKAGYKMSNLPEFLLIKEEYPGSISQKRRHRQIFSRLQIQWANRNLLVPRCWVGLAKSITQLVTPAWLSMAVKNIINRG